MVNLPERIHEANLNALDAMRQANPVWVDVRPALEVLPGMSKNTVLHTGPPIAWEDMCGPQKMVVQQALIYEGLVDDEEAAAAMIRAGEVVLAPCHEYQAVGGMAGITSASSPMVVVRNEQHGNYA